MRAPSFARFTIVTAKVAHSSPLAEGMADADWPQLDPAWLARLLAMPEPPTPPARQKGCAAPGGVGGPLPDLLCDEIMPQTTSGPPVHKPWPFHSPSPTDGSTLPPYASRRRIAASVVARLDPGRWQAHYGRACLTARSHEQTF